MLSVVILAAGAGTRMKSDTPKVLHTLCGRSMLSLSIDCALTMSEDIHIVLFHKAELVKEQIQRDFGALVGEKIFFHLQDHQNFPGTGGALRGIETKHKRILVLNGDMPLVQESSLRELCARKESIVLSVLFWKILAVMGAWC